MATYPNAIKVSTGSLRLKCDTLCCTFPYTSFCIALVNVSMVLSEARSSAEKAVGIELPDKSAQSCLKIIHA